MTEPEAKSSRSEVPGRERPGTGGGAYDDDVAPFGPPQYIAGVVVALAVMIFGQIPMAVISRTISGLYLQAIPLVVVVTLTFGLVVAWLVVRISRGWTGLKASLLFFVVGGVTGFLWGYAIFKALTLGLDTSHVLPSVPVPLVGAVYVGSTAGLGALCGRLFAAPAARSPRGVTITASVIAVLAVIGAFKLY